MRAHVLPLALPILLLTVFHHTSSLPLHHDTALDSTDRQQHLAGIDKAVRDFPSRNNIEPAIEARAALNNIQNIKWKRSPQLLERKRYLRKELPPYDISSNGTVLSDQLIEYEFNVFRNEDLRTQGLL